MPHRPQHQFDPVAASAIAALNAAQRTERTVRNQMGTPAPPGADSAVNSARDVLMQVSSFSPLNVLGSGRSPDLPGMQGAGGLPNPQQFLPGMQGAGGLPQLPGMQGAGGLPNPQQLLPSMGQQTGMTGRRQRPSGNGENGGNGGASDSETDTNPGRNATDSRA
jgi:hypothetical protein